MTAKLEFSQTLDDLPRRAAVRFGSKMALVTKGRSYSFAEIDASVDSLAGGLAGLGLGAGDRILLHLPNGWEWIVAYYATSRIGAVVVPANILLVSEEIRFIANDCGAAAVVAPSERMGALRAAPVPSSVRHFIGIGPGQMAGIIALDDLLVSAEALESVSKPDDVSTIAYTSGTTGHPKGAMLTHRAVILNTVMTANMHMRTAEDTVVTALPFSHVYGNVVMNGAFLCNLTLVAFERFDAVAVLEAIQRHRATLFEGVPTMYYYLLNCPQLQDYDLSSLTRATVGGQTMTLTQMRKVEQRFGCPLVELWGMTEIAGLGTTHPLLGPRKLGSIGRPLPFMECRIAALDDGGRMVADGEYGELMVRGATVMVGYYNNQTATEEVLRPDGWLHTGDIGYRDSDGYYFVVDRKKEMIITAGYNVYPSELERVIAQHPAVAIVAVAGVPDEVKGELAKAFVVLKPNVQCSEDEILSHCRQHLAAYKVPRLVQFLDCLPTTSTGKIIRRNLKSWAASGEQR